MASDKQIAANRANAKKSTGPRTPAGRAKSSRNAYRHGLSVPMQPDPLAVEALALTIAGNTADDGQLRAARALSEAHLKLQTIRKIRVAAIPAALNLVLNSQTLAHLCALDRYERQAARQRKAAGRVWIDRWPVTQPVADRLPNKTPVNKTNPFFGAK